TVNDYLARRDAEWMGQIYGFLGMSTGVVVGGLSHDEKQAAYAADITYGTNNEYGFDYLRDNMVFTPEQKVQRPLSFAIIDEVDSILIDEARTPLIISGPGENSHEVYNQVNALVPQLEKQDMPDKEASMISKMEDQPIIPGDYSVDEKGRQVYLSEAGHERVEALLIESGLLEDGDNLYNSNNIALMHHFNSALRAHALFQKDVDYIVKDDKIVIVDEFTGRTLPGRRWSDGLHQAVEAKEGVSIQAESQTLASITFQNYFRVFDKLSGMTGTADTEAYELQQIYGLEVVVVPTNRPMVRKDFGDVIFLTQKEKYVAILEDIKGCVAEQRPVLVGTASIESSEIISKLLNDAGVVHEVLNAKQHEREAHIVENAGMPGAITIATNMAGRGTDIVLGGNLKALLLALGEDASEEQIMAVQSEWEARNKLVLDKGGLHIIGTERNESRRVDNQLRGRAGRQGDAGSSRFYLALDDDLMRIFASPRLANMMRKLGMGDGEAVEHTLVSRAIENAQRKVEGRNFDVRKQLLKFDDVANDQRKVIYEQRNDLMGSADISENLHAIREDVVNGVVDEFIPPQSFLEQWNVPSLEDALHNEFGLPIPVQQWLKEDDDLHEETLRKRVIDEIEAAYDQKAQLPGPEVMRGIEKEIMLSILDSHWKDHLAAMDYLRQGIGLRGYAQKNPEQEYKRESFEMFQQMLESIKHEVVTVLSRIELRPEAEVEDFESNHQLPEMDFQHAPAEMLLGAESDVSADAEPPLQAPAAEDAEAHKPFVRDGRKVGRNEPCPCGSGKKFKQCHGKLS
ncbi:MAG: preprotein translocase subunit SecA, partial [Methylococcales bacterium]|nr:preprotein translocase subunit SecA [Methylococcales bacterium]